MNERPEDATPADLEGQLTQAKFLFMRAAAMMIQSWRIAGWSEQTLRDAEECVRQGQHLTLEVTADERGEPLISLVAIVGPGLRRLLQTIPAADETTRAN